MRLPRPIGIFLLLWPTLGALWIAKQGVPDLKILIIFILGTIVMRSAGCVINDFADRHIDGLVTRTKERPLATGVVSVKEALALFIFLATLALLLVVQLNFFTLKLAVVALLLAMLYPFTKRYCHFPQVFLGAAYAWAIPLAFAAQTNAVPMIAWVFFTATLLWSVVYDTMYAMVDRVDDLRIGVKSTAILFAHNDRLLIGFVQIIILLLLVYVGCLAKFHAIYFASLILVAILGIYQQYLIKDRDAKNCFKAFLNNNWLGLVIFLGILLNYL